MLLPLLLQRAHLPLPLQKLRLLLPVLLVPQNIAQRDHVLLVLLVFFFREPHAASLGGYDYIGRRGGRGHDRLCGQREHGAGGFERGGGGIALCS